MQKISKYILWAILLLLCGYVLFFSEQVRCALVSWSALEAYGPDFYVHPDLPTAQKAEAVKMYEEAQLRVADFFGSLEGTPVIIIGSTSEIYHQFGGKTLRPGMSHIAPFGSYVVLGPEGINVDVLSHELCHTELAARIGWYNRALKIPTWFDEGLALMLDYRYLDAGPMWRQMTNNGKNAPPLNKLENMKDFMELTEISPYLSYVTAMVAVYEWWAVGGQEGLNKFMYMINNGNNFEEAFKLSINPAP